MILEVIKGLGVGVGLVFFDIVHPEMVALRIGIGKVRTTYPRYLVQQGTIGQGRPA